MIDEKREREKERKEGFFSFSFYGARRRNGDVLLVPTALMDVNLSIVSSLSILSILLRFVRPLYILVCFTIYP